MSKHDALDHPDLRKVWDRFETQAPTVDWDDLTSHGSVEQTPTRGRRPAGPLVAAGTFALVLVVGAVAWLAGSPDDPVPGGPLANLDWDLMATFPAPADPEAFIDQFDAIDGVRSVDYYPNVAVFYEPPPVTDATDDVVETTIRGPEPTGEEPLTAAVLVLLEDPEQVENVAHEIDQTFDPYQVEYSPDFQLMLADQYFERIATGATRIGEDPLTYQAALGPEPKFDTSRMGTEVELAQATDSSVISQMFWDLTATPIFEDEAVRDPESAVYHIGLLDQTDTRLVVYRNVDGERCENELMPGGGAGGGCGDAFGRYRYGAMGYGGVEGETANLRVEVPPGTSVVAVTVDDGQPMWQRPTAGLALFPAQIEDYDFVEFDVAAYDTLGHVIGRWDELS